MCFPSGIYIGTDRQRDKWHWIKPFLNALRDVSAPLVTHVGDLSQESIIAALRNTSADLETEPEMGWQLNQYCRGLFGERGGEAQQSGRCGGWMAAKRRPIIPQQTLRLNMSEAVRERERERCKKQQVVGGGVGYAYILYKHFMTTLVLKKSHQKSSFNYTHSTNE